MQSVQILNASPYAVSIRGLGSVTSGVARTGYINQITFDDDFISYKDKAAKRGILVRDPAATYTPAGYNSVTAIETLVAADRFVAVTTAAANYVLTLMAANAVPVDTVVYFFHESGAFTASITRAGADTIDGGAGALALAIATPVRRLKSDGVSAWVSV